MKWFKRKKRKKFDEWRDVALESTLFTAKMILTMVLLGVIITFFSVRYVQLEQDDSTAQTYQDAKNYVLGR